VVVYKLRNEIFEERRLNIPVVDLLLLEIIASIPITLHIVVWEILWKTVFDEELFVFAQLG
jgi:hypothetical protein